MEKKILFRVDAGEKVGLGHFFRSLHLAQALKKKKYKVTFVHKESKFWNTVEDFNFEHLTLNDEDPNKHMIELCREEGFKLLYVDAILDFNKNDVLEAKTHTKIIFYQNISESRYFADVFILPSIHQKKSFFDEFDKSRTKIYKGLKYFTFNYKVSKLVPKTLNLEDKAKRIGIICGGSDPKNTMNSIFKLINFENWKPQQFNFYYGINYMHMGTLPENYPSNVNFYEYNQEEINKNDTLIAAFGVSTYEFMALGMPIISFGHQESNAIASKQLALKTKALYHLGQINYINKEDLQNAIEKLLNNAKFRLKLSEKSKKLLDFKGIKRIVKIIDNLHNG